ncbi:MAG: HlyD family secretion protein [Deltaproteobacteria bacterium]|nr:HlyD family secretion protein [Deltaproteobacteria bacterium]
MDAEVTKRRGRVLRWIVVAAVVIAGVTVGARYAWHAHLYESTDDAFVDGTIVRVAPQVPGRVSAVPVASNQRVEVGELLVALDPADLRIELSRSQASRAQAEGRLVQARAQVSVARAAFDQARAAEQVAEVEARNAAQDLRRYQQVSTGAVSRQALDNAETTAKRTVAEATLAESRERAAQAEIELAESAVTTAEAEVRNADVLVRQAEQQLSYSEVRAPLAGRITMKGVESGDFVQVGQALMALVSDEVWVVANFKETQLAEMKPGQQVEIRVDAFPAHALHGHVESIQAGAAARFSLMPPENATGNYVKVVQRVPVRIRFDEPAENLRGLAPGMSVVPEVRVR